ncbi:MAG: GIY-YIG nuclease family protein [Prolixibacteraceae bacterium]|jgi:putative endonuclease|nr:GIY-YIG nuclease family protein [Prolixibacteraceae bacterium]
MYKVYILYSLKIDRYYIGYTNDIGRRLSEHNRRKGKYTDRGIPWELLHQEVYLSKELAQHRERYLKSQKSRKFIEDLLRLSQ